MSSSILPLRLASRLVLGAVALALTASDSCSQFPIETFKVHANDAAPSDFLGAAIAVSGTIALCGAVGGDGNGSSSGAVYMFRTTTGQQFGKLLPNDGNVGDQFGSSVAISGTTAIVGAWGDDDNGSASGSAYLFDITTGLQLAKLLPSDGAAQDLFGISIAVSGTTAIVGASRDDDNGADSGSAYLFDITTGLQLAKLVPSDGARGDEFGVSVAISGATAIVGAWRNDEGGSDSGLAYLFDVNTGLQTAKLKPSSSASGDQFGRTVGISGTTAIIGAFSTVFSMPHCCPDSGSAYLFDTTTGSQLAKLVPSDGLDFLGASVAISGTTAIVGARFYVSGSSNQVRGAAYFFDTTTGLQLARRLPSDGFHRDGFGLSVALSNTTAICGDPRDGDTGNGQFSGAAYFFNLINFASLCNGDGGDQTGCVNCPCGNDAPGGTSGGCLNSASISARLEASGSSSVSLPASDTTDLRFALTGAPANAFCVLNSGGSLAPGNPAHPCFGLNSGVQAVAFDGLRCAIFNTRRHGGRAADANGEVGTTNSPWGGEGGPPAGIAVAGSGFVPGQFRYFQVVYRDDPSSGCMRGLNTSQAVEVVFAP